MKYIFNLGSGRSGTKFLSEMARLNAPKTIARHEANPPMHGAPIEWAEKQEWGLIRRLFKSRMEYPEGAYEAYLESSHLFLKAFAEVAVQEFEPEELWFTHLFRNPLDVAWSHQQRMQPYDKVCFANPYCLKPNTGLFKKVQGESGYQQWLLHWIEIENRAMAFLEADEDDDREERCFDMYAPHAFKSDGMWERFFHFFGLTARSPIIFEGAQRNGGTGKPRPQWETERELYEVVEALACYAPQYLEIFHSEPYASIDESWARILRGEHG